jgi:CRP/FNR family transcriptional regulator
MSVGKDNRSTSSRSIDSVRSELSLPLESFGPSRDIRRKTILCNQGDRIESLYLIEAGAVKLMGENPRGRRVLVGIRSNGWLLGAAPAAAGKPWHVTAETLLPARVRRLSLRAFQQDVDRDREFRWWVFQLIGEDLVDRTRQSTLVLEDLGDRLARFLTELAAIGERRADGIVLPPLTHDEIAEAVPCGREAVTRELARFEQGGLIRRAGRRIVVPLSSRLAPQWRI